MIQVYELSFKVNFQYFVIFICKRNSDTIDKIKRFLKLLGNIRVFQITYRVG